jgi:hypothetical protein
MLNLNALKEYNDFIEKHGIVSQNGIEIYGVLEHIDNELLPSVVAATKLYKDNYHLKDKEIVISFDDFLNCPVVLDENNVVYNVFLDKKEKIADSFNEWFLKIKEEYELDLDE